LKGRPSLEADEKLRSTVVVDGLVTLLLAPRNRFDVDTDDADAFAASPGLLADVVFRNVTVAALNMMVRMDQEKVNVRMELYLYRLENKCMFVCVCVCRPGERMNEYRGTMITANAEMGETTRRLGVCVCCWSGKDWLSLLYASLLSFALLCLHASFSTG
jgi:hypothetical protein